MARTIKHTNEADETTPALFGEMTHLDFALTHSFTQMVFEMLAERTPSQNELKMMHIMLNLSIDHGPNSPSASATIAAAKEGKKMGEAVACGITQINETHGGAIEPAMNFFYKIRDDGQKSKNLVREYLNGGKFIAGFGHRVYKDEDPRAQLILNEFQKTGEGEEFIEIAQEVEKEIEEAKQKHLPINIDGAIAAVLCSWGWEPRCTKPQLSLHQYLSADAFV